MSVSVQVRMQNSWTERMGNYGRELAMTAVTVKEPRSRRPPHHVPPHCVVLSMSLQRGHSPTPAAPNRSSIIKSMIISPNAPHLTVEPGLP